MKFDETVCPVSEYELKILASLKKGSSRIEELLNDTNISRATLFRLLKKLVKLGLVVKDYDLKLYPPPAFYYITERGMKALEERRRAFIESLPEYILGFFVDFTERKQKEIAEIVELLRNRLNESLIEKEEVRIV